jgi:CheY-like chemotaxis protein
VPARRTEKLQIMLDDAELEAIDAWRFENYMPSRAAAVRALLHVALKGRGAKSTRPASVVASRDIGVVESSPEMQTALGTGARKKVLLVEDEYLIAAGLELIVEELGYEVLGPVNGCEEARALLDREQPHAAVLDFALGNKTSLELAELLMQRKIPIMFCTGVNPNLPDEMRSVPVVSKPHIEAEMAAVLSGLIGSGRAGT